MSANYGDTTVELEHQYEGDIIVTPFDGSAESWVRVVNNQHEIWRDGQRILGMEYDWCDYAKSALCIMPEEVKSEVCMMHPNIPQAAACAK